MMGHWLMVEEKARLLWVTGASKHFNGKPQYFNYSMFQWSTTPALPFTWPNYYHWVIRRVKWANRSLITDQSWWLCVMSYDEPYGCCQVDHNKTIYWLPLYWPQQSMFIRWLWQWSGWGPGVNSAELDCCWTHVIQHETDPRLFSADKLIDL